MSEATRKGGWLLGWLRPTVQDQPQAAETSSSPNGAKREMVGPLAPAFLPRQPDPERPSPYPISRMGERPSYRYKLLESKRRRYDAAHLYDTPDPIMEINDKFRAYVFADRHSVDHPTIYGSYDGISEVDWEALPDAFVLKSRTGSSNRGVKALVRRGDAFMDLLRDRTWTIPEMVEHQAELEEKQQASPQMFAEELVWKVNVDGAIADDWKFYCFYGRVGLAMQRDLKKSGDPSDWKFKFWDRDWSDLGPVKFVDRLDQDLPPPVAPEAMVAMAERLSVLIRRPFVRVDLFESERGPLLGEFTPAPGPPEVFTADVDEMLGRLWEDAEARIFAEEVGSGWWDHLRVD